MKAKLTVAVFALLLSGRLPAQETITEAELVRRTQELFDAVAPGDQGPWKKYFADDCLYFDEKGRNMDKAALVADIAPLPAGYSGTIKIAKVQSRIAGDTAILSYDTAETEIVFGQQLTARYHATDTWRRRNGTWQILAGQVLRYYEDPPAGRADPARFPDFAGSYELVPGKTLRVLAEGENLYLERDGKRTLLLPEAGDIFFRSKVEGRCVFRRTADGKVDAFISRRNNEDIVWRKTGT
ncbi:DUF4440 domain-containing protein [Opitutus sp. GAS368]|jgi:hypothetical protein|uniref:nuclear transport factor 2 family protein n=1 Tax=Opitutus sp. GAS368 TaxID=1882749 RepID=UPI00087D6987|nr:DUF4440 domain-containing protein [Opitutus sp. GAS368]SDR69635.1 protein of unknown function [Opitutus sp. GAS368]